jgi:hypothetical protein
MRRIGVLAVLSGERKVCRSIEIAMLFGLSVKHISRSGTGLELIREIHAFERTVPILMFTAMKGKLYETASLDAGARDFLGEDNIDHSGVHDCEIAGDHPPLSVVAAVEM